MAGYATVDRLIVHKLAPQKVVSCKSCERASGLTDWLALYSLTLLAKFIIFSASLTNRGNM